MLSRILANDIGLHALFGVRTRIITCRIALSIGLPGQSLAMQQISNRTFVQVALSIAGSDDLLAGDHRQIVRVRGMEQTVIVLKDGALPGQTGKVRLGDRGLIASIFEHDDQHAVEPAGGDRRAGTGAAAGNGRIDFRCRRRRGRHERSAPDAVATEAPDPNDDEERVSTTWGPPTSCHRCRPFGHGSL